VAGPGHGASGGRHPALALVRGLAPAVPFTFVSGARDCVPKLRLDWLGAVVAQAMDRPEDGGEEII